MSARSVVVLRMRYRFRGVGRVSAYGVVGSEEQWKTDPARAAGSLFVNVGSMLIPGGGEVAAGAKVVSVGARMIEVGDKAAEAADVATEAGG